MGIRVWVNLRVMHSIWETLKPFFSSSKPHPILSIRTAFVLESLCIRERESRERKRMFHPKQQKPSSMNSHHERPMCVQGDSGLVLTTDPKPRLRWTVELHERFVDAVTQLGGPDSAYIYYIYICTYSSAVVFLLSPRQTLIIY